MSDNTARAREIVGEAWVRWGQLKGWTPENEVFNPAEWEPFVEVLAAALTAQAAPPVAQADADLVDALVAAVGAMEQSTDGATDEAEVARARTAILARLGAQAAQTRALTEDVAAWKYSCAERDTMIASLTAQTRALREAAQDALEELEAAGASTPRIEHAVALLRAALAALTGAPREPA